MARKVWLLAVLLLVAGCGGSGGGSSSSGGGSGSGTLVRKDTGGTVSNGRATVTIPAGALDADTRISVEAPSGSLPAAPTGYQILGGTAYDLGPSGTTFSTPATLTLTYNASSVPTGTASSSIGVYTVASGLWQPVAGSAVDEANHKVTVPLAHFSVYALLCPQAASTTARYDVIDLGALPGDVAATPYSISTDGRIGGLSVSSSGDLHGFFWQNGSMFGLAPRAGDKWSWVKAVNAAGSAVGISLPDSSNAFPVLWQNGTVTQLETPTGLQGGQATALNDSGDYIVNQAIFRKGTLTAFSGFTPSTEAAALNGAGQVAGYVDSNAAIWLDGSITTVGVLPGYDYARGAVISEGGTLVGTAANASDNLPVGFMYKNGTFTKIAPLAGDDIVLPHGVNDSGIAVGSSSKGFVTVRGFLFQNGVTQPLDSLIGTTTSGWQILQAYGINNKGQIIGLAIDKNAVNHGVLLQPKG